MSELGNKVKNLRKSLEQTQIDVANSTGLSVQYICRLEKGKQPSVRLQTAQVLAKHFNAPVSFLIDEVDETNWRTDKEIVKQTHRLAVMFYKMLGYVHVTELHGYLFNSQHPTELRMWEMACLAQEVLTDTDVNVALAEVEDEL